MTISGIGTKINKRPGFTLVELLVATAVMAVGLVFVLGALARCATSLTLARRTVTASTLLNAKLWDLDLEHKANNGSEIGEWEGGFEEPHNMFRWTQEVTPLTANLTEVMTTDDPSEETTSEWSNAFLEETVAVSWTQSRRSRNVSVTRYVRRRASDAGGET